MIRPKAEYSLEIEGETLKSSGVSISEHTEAETRSPTAKPRIKPKADYSVEVNE